jgi:origin recognition complex subunit 1
LLGFSHQAVDDDKGSDNDDDSDAEDTVYVCQRAYDPVKGKFSALKRHQLDGGVEGEGDPNAASSDDDDSDFEPAAKDDDADEEEDDADEEEDEDEDTDEEEEDRGDDGEFGGSNGTGKMRRKKASRSGTQGKKRGRPAGKATASSASAGGGGGKRKAKRVKAQPPPPAARLTIAAAKVGALGGKSALDRARAKLHVASAPGGAAAAGGLPCREVEFHTICEFVRNQLAAGIGSCMFVSGVPGTGKTASIRAVSEALQAERDAGDIANFQFIEVNGMMLTTPQQIYSELWQAVRDNKGPLIRIGPICVGAVGQCHAT